MAKRGTLDHPKTRRLANLLGLEPWGALGILEALWHFTGQFAPDGELSRFKSSEIAAGVRYTGNANELLSALMEAGWIDKYRSRLVIHDWPDHADQAVKKRVERLKVPFAFLPRRPSKTPHRDGQYPDVSGQSADMDILPEPEPEPVPVPEPEPRARDGDPEWDRLLEEYPGQKNPEWDARFWVSVDDHILFWRNFALWKQTRQWADGFAPTLENYLRKGKWKRPPPPEPERKSERERLLESI